MIRALLLVALLAGCGTGQSSGPAGIRFEAEGVRFTAPGGWLVEPARGASFGGHWLVYVATQEVHDSCTADRSDPCPPPLEELSNGGVLIAWYTTTCAGPDCTLPSGEPTRVGRREAVKTGARDACGGIAQTEETQYVVAVSPQRIDTIVVCGRSTSEATRATISSFLDGIEWRTP
jgi:hypothetical protein